MKKVLAAVVVLLLLAGAGYYLYTKSAHKMATTAANNTTQNSGGMFGSIQDALSKSLSLQCTFTGDNSVPTTAYIKAGAVRVDTTGKTPQETGSFIMKDKKMYYWQDSTKQGTIMTVPEVTVSPVPTGGQTVQPTGTSNQETNIMAALEKFKDSCKPAVVADSLFTPPSDVKFTDMTQMMHQMQTSGTQSGAYPTGMTQQDVQKMMQQYQPTGASGY